MLNRIASKYAEVTAKIYTHELFVTINNYYYSVNIIVQ